jgi:hypothetical protein
MKCKSRVGRALTRLNRNLAPRGRAWTMLRALALYILVGALASGCFARITAQQATETSVAGGLAGVPTVGGLPTLPPVAQQPTPVTPIETPPGAPPTLTTAPIPDQPTPVTTPTVEGRPPMFPTMTPQPTAPPGPSVPSGPTIQIWFSPTVPVELQAALQPLIIAGKFVLVAAPEQAQVSVISLPAGTTSPLTSRWVYVPVVPFGTVAENISLGDIQRYWRGDLNALAGITDNQQPPSFVTTAPLFFWLTQALGSPAQNVPVEVVAPENVAPTMWGRRQAWGLVPFNRLAPELKALTLDGNNVFNKAIPSEQWPLGETFGLTGDPTLVQDAASAIATAGGWIPTNRDVSKLTTLIMTGVTALARVTAWKMETQGITYPMRDIAPFLADGDIIHTSNEVSFTSNCPNPSANSTTTTFCSKESYFQLLAAMKLNVVELTGNHGNDYGADAFNNSLDIYNKWSIPYFGGGRNTADARKAAILVSNGNTIAFVGCNPVGPPGAWATDTRPGAARCDDDFLRQEIPRLKGIADVVIMTIQYQESYQYGAPPDQVAFFRKYAQMGANLVMGSQAHQPQGFAFADGAFIHYGIGNLFFDQMWSIGTRQMFADKIYIYNGRHLSTALFTGLIEDYARPRPMTAQERATFLRTIFRASGW